MRALQFWKAVVRDDVNLLDRLLDLFSRHQIRFCVIGGQAVNAYLEPLVSLDLDVVIAVDQLDGARSLLAAHFDIEEFPFSLNVSDTGSDLRVQIQTDPRYFAFVDRAEQRELLGVKVPVASLTDVLAGKVWAATDPLRRPSKQRKDLLDIERILEAAPDLRTQVPAALLARLDL